MTEKRDIRTIAFPCISTGAYEFPYERAGSIAVKEVRKYLEGSTSVEKVAFVCFLKRDHECYARLLSDAP